MYKHPELISASTQLVAYSLMVTFLWPPFPQKRRGTVQYLPCSCIVLCLPPMPLWLGEVIRELEGTSCKSGLPSRDNLAKSPRRDHDWDSFTLAVAYSLLYGLNGCASSTTGTTAVEGGTRTCRRHSRTRICSSDIESLAFWHRCVLSLAYNVSNHPRRDKWKYFWSLDLGE